ncbi:MAG: gliding motility-associated C-terminal domain-containing protein [Cyanothece sp. SIO1E1]|nr:gliding motility-associated C-terminal domain-containing protein [Cyanothece sp. SIO1E1]
MKQFFPVMMLFIALYAPLTSSAADYYWIGGAGNWSDISHWATSSGGVLTHPQVPTAADDVYFDANSFTGPNQVVVINNENIFLRNMDWTGAIGAPQLIGDAAKVMNIHGSLNLIPDMQFSFEGQIRFRSAQPQTPINSAQHPLGNSIFFNGTGGWVMEESIVVDSLIQLENGRLNTNGQAIDAGYFYVDIQNSGELLLGNSKITLTGSNIYQQIGDDFFAYFVLQIKAHDQPFDIDPGNSLIEINSSDATAEIQVNRTLQLHDVLFSNDNGSAFWTQFYEAPINLNTLTFNNSANIWGNLGGQELILAPGKFYQFAGGYFYPFEQITAIGNCQANITIQGNETGEGSTANFQSNAQNISLDYVNLKNITATGSASFLANNSVDLGNNTGWTINSRSVQNLFWVGGSGNWNDPDHWSLSSGGPGGACIPSGTDNVFFDQNSFNGPNQFVELLDADLFCRDMTWTGANFIPAFRGGYDPILHIFGSLTLVPEMFYQFGGLLKFESRELGKTITSTNHLINKIEFNSSSGGWTLLDSLRSETFIFLEAGTLRTNDQYVESTHFSNGNSGLFRRLELGNTHWVIRHFPDSQKDQWSVSLEGFELDAGTSTIEFIGEREYFEHFGNSSINYHKLIFRNDVGHLLNLNHEVRCTIDSLEFKHGGYIYNDFTINNISFSPGYTYQFKEGTTQDIQNIIAPANCNELITLKSDASGNAAFLNVTDPRPDLQYLSLRDLHSIGPGNLSAQLSIDQGNNLGWDIDELGNRTLYWVGGAGDWQDQAHWSLASGGNGGECVPTLRDDVIFDENSFTGTGQNVTGQEFNGYYCRNISWEDGLPNPSFDLKRLYTHGSLRFGNNMDNLLEHLHLSGDGPQTTEFQTQSLRYVYLEGSGNYTLLDDLTAEELILRSGGLDVNDQVIQLQRWRMQNENTLLNLDLGASVIRLSAAFDNTSYTLEAPYGNNTTIVPGSSQIYLDDPFASAYLSGGLDFHNLIFTGTEGQLQICHAPGSSALDNPVRLNLLELSGDALIKGYHESDTLIFAPGKSYRLEQGVTQTVNEHLQILGNNCNPIELFSTLPGTSSTMRMTSGSINADFIQMQDQIGTGGISFFAGVHSTDIGGSNQGWIFESSPTFTDQGFFGPDQSFCEGESVTLSAYSYSLGETYEWSTTSTAPEIEVSQAGTYWAKVTFGNMCEILDTIEINTIDPAQIELGPDVSPCEGEPITLDASSSDTGVNYLWQDNSTSPMYQVDTAGVYFVTLDKQGCLSSDTIRVSFIPSPQVELGPDQTLCEGQRLTLDASINEPAQYLWQDGATTPDLAATQSGIFSVQVTANGCTGQDEIMLTFNPLPQFTLGSDTSLCSGQTLEFDFSDVGDNFLWQDGSTNPNYSIQQGGEIRLQVERNGCAAVDSIQVQLFQTPVVDLGPDQSLCEGQSLTLDAAINEPAQYLWQDGTTIPNLIAIQSGTFSVQVTANGCTGQDEINLTFNPLPQFTLGPDTSLCSGQSLEFDFSDVGDNFLWQDGSTNPNYSVQQGGEIRLQVERNGCAAVDSIQVQLFQTPVVDLGPDQSLCEGQSLTLDAAINEPAQYLWQDGATTSDLAATQSGTFSVQVTANGCTGQDEINLTFNQLPQFTLGPDTSLCSGQSLNFDLSDVGDNFLWQDGSTNAEYTIQQGGEIWVQVESAGCSATDSIQVQLFDAPNVDLGPDQTLCEGQSLTLDASINQPAQYLWQDGANTSDLAATQSGTFSVQVTANGCTGQDEINLTFNPLPQFTLGPDTSLCSGQSLDFDLSDVGDNFLWQDGSTNVEYTIQQGGEIWVQIESAGCSATDSIQVQLFDTPNVDLGPDQSLCEGQSITLDASINEPAQYLWQDGATTPDLAATQSGTFSVQVTANGCTGQDQISLTFNPLPQFTLGPDTSLCSGQSLNFDLSDVGDNFLWQDGSTNAEYTIQQGGEIWVQIENAGCSTTDFLQVQFSDAPVVELGPDQSLCEGESVEIEANAQDYDSFFWQDGSTSPFIIAASSGYLWLEAQLGNCTTRDSILIEFEAPLDLVLPDSIVLCRGESQLLQPKLPPGTSVQWQDGSSSSTYLVDTPGLYSLLATKNGCVTEASVVATASNCGKIEVFTPNAFSPNDDGIHDSFFPQFPTEVNILDYQLKIFDRWGALIFSSPNAEQVWDGSFAGRPAGIGVYVFLIEFSVEEAGEVFSQQVAGSVTLLR